MHGPTGVLGSYREQRRRLAPDGPREISVIRLPFAVCDRDCPCLPLPEPLGPCCAGSSFLVGSSPKTIGSRSASDSACWRSLGGRSNGGAPDAARSTRPRLRLIMHGREQLARG